MSKTKSLLEFLETGKSISSKEMFSKFGIQDTGGMIYNLRTKGYPIYTNKTVDNKGNIIYKYRMGKASKRLIAAGYLFYRSVYK